MTRPTMFATGSRSRSTSPTSTRAAQLAADCRAVVRRRQGRPRAVLGRRAGGDRALRDARLPGVRRPQAARHPDHRRPRGARARPARCRATSTSTPRAASTCCAPVSKVWSKARATPDATAPVPIAVTVLTSDPDASAVRRASRVRDRSGLRRCRVLGARDRARASARAGFRHDRSRRSTRGRRPSTIKRASARRRRSRRRAPTCSWSAARSPRADDPEVAARQLYDEVGAAVASISRV